MDFEFETKRTGLANAFADAGRDLLDYMGTGSALAAIPDTDTPCYAVAGTLPAILSIAGKLMDESALAVAPSQVPAELTDGRIDAIAKKYAGMGGVEDYRSFAREIASEVRLSAVREARNEALEEAAKICEKFGDDVYQDHAARAMGSREDDARESMATNCADAIRALKSEAPAASKEGDSHA
jgi:hypothetical protein